MGHEHRHPAIPSSSSRGSTAGVILPFVFLLALALFTFSPLIADPDLWGHVRFGQDTLLTRDITAH